MAQAQGKFVGFQPQGLYPTALGVAFARNSFLKAWQFGSVTFSAALVTHPVIAEQALTITGATVNDLCILSGTGAPTTGVALLGTARVSAANTVQARYINPTAGDLTPPASQVIFFALFQVQ